MLAVIGIFLLVFGVTAVLIGDKPLPMGEGRISRLFSTTPRVARWRKWLIGLGAAYAGVMVLYRAGWRL